ncbi:AbgT family transporter [Paenibacillus sp. MABNR03]|uniref:AbgT family transporter n=1 Tax=Paenibacillus sp. MABNR03 TaxID=3142626 RepID=UPI003D292A52
MIFVFITDLLEKTGINGIPVVIGLIFLSALLTMFIASGSAMWSILAPVFIPMMMLLGFHPAFTQVIFRVSDSVIIPLAPVSPFVPLFVGFLQEYRKDAKLGTYYSLILPYSIAFFSVWVVMVILWYVFNLPLGPGVHPRL